MLVIVGFALRLYQIDTVPFRGDEAHTVQYWADQPLANTLETISTVDPHPPLAYAMFRGWRLLFGEVGISEFIMRILPALLNVIGIPAIYALGKRMSGQPVGLLSALLWTVHPYQIWHAQDARNYAIWSAFSLISLWLATRALDSSRKRDWILFTAAAVLATYTYYLELFMFVAMSSYVAVAYWRNWRVCMRWAVSMLIVGGLLLIWLLYLRQRLLAGGSVYGGTTGGLDWVRLLSWFLPTLNFGVTLPQAFVDSYWPLLTITLVVALVVLWRGQWRSALLLGLLGIVPLMLLAAVSARLNIFTPRYVLAAAPVYTLLFATLAVEGSRLIRQPMIQRGVSALLISAWLGISGYSLYNYYFDPLYAKSHDWPALTDYLREHTSPDDLVIQTSVDAAFGVYYDAPATDIGLPANPEEPVADIIATLENAQERYRSIWLVANPFTDWPNAGVVDAWVLENMQQVRDTETDGLRIEQYMTWVVPPEELDSAQVFSPPANFGVTELLGVRVFPPEPSGVLTIWAYWHPLSTSERPLKVFVHLIGAMNPATGTPLWTQDDRFPQNGRIESTSWTADRLYRDVYVLPLEGVPSGEYQLEIGLYDVETNERDTLVTGGDSFVVGQITLP
ncbi:MAG: glycosyltransferase family 39 protein [Burkholderiales bacterium]|nr:glycosyltransferase family 39 protein [Anaerolineae bacterium]